MPEFMNFKHVSHEDIVEDKEFNLDEYKEGLATAQKDWEENEEWANENCYDSPMVCEKDVAGPVWVEHCQELESSSESSKEK